MQPTDDWNSQTRGAPAAPRIAGQAAQTTEQPRPVLDLLERIAAGVECLIAALSNGHFSAPGDTRAAWSSISRSLERIAARLDPPPADVIDSTDLAARLGCTTTWIAQLARQGRIPESCIVPGTGSGKPWRFYRTRIDAWLAAR